MNLILLCFLGPILASSSLKLPSLFEISSQRVLEISPNEYLPINNEFDVLGVLACVLYHCIGQEEILENLLTGMASKDAKFITILNEMGAENKTIKQLFISHGLNDLFYTFANQNHTLSSKVKIILSLTLIKIEGGSNYRKRAFYHISSRISVHSLPKNYLFFKKALKMITIDGEFTRLVKELRADTQKSALFLELYNNIIGDLLNLDDLENTFKVKVVSRVSRSFEINYRDENIDKVYKAALEAFLAGGNYLFRFVSEELGSYMRTWPKFDINRIITICSQISDDRVTFAILDEYRPPNTPDPSTIINIGNAFTLRWDILERFIKVYFETSGPWFLSIHESNDPSFKNLYKTLSKYEFNPNFVASLTEGTEGPLEPIFIFPEVGNFYRHRSINPPYFNFHLTDSRITFSIRMDSSGIMNEGRLGMKVRIFGEILFFGKIKTIDILDCENLYNRLCAGCPYIFYDLFQQGISIFKLINPNLNNSSDLIM
jgi:hypothetical protein